MYNIIVGLALGAIIFLPLGFSAGYFGLACIIAAKALDEAVQ
jgi:hypothetical protein